MTADPLSLTEISIADSYVASYVFVKKFKPGIVEIPGFLVAGAGFESVTSGL